MDAFQFQTIKNLIVGNGSLSQLANECHSLGITHALLVTDHGILSQNLHQKISDICAKATIKLTLYSDVIADPPFETVLKAVDFAKQHQINGIIGFGGGSSLDVAKLIAVLAHPNQKQHIEQMYGIGQITGTRLPLIQIPTTAGTGSEVTPIAIVTTGETTKTGIVSPVLYADTALLDASLTLQLPALITAATGIDAMVHAIEAFTSKFKKNAYSDMLAKEALIKLNKALPICLSEPTNISARQDMLFGAMLAGQAFANAPVAAVHALAYPLGGHCHLSHGHSNALVLIEVLKFNLPVAKQYYAELMRCLFPLSEGSEEDLASSFIQHMQSICQNSGLTLKLNELNVEEHLLTTLAHDAMLQTRLLSNNPRKMTEQDALTIYKAIY